MTQQILILLTIYGGSQSGPHLVPAGDSQSLLLTSNTSWYTLYTIHHTAPRVCVRCHLKGRGWGQKCTWPFWSVCSQYNIPGQKFILQPFKHLYYCSEWSVCDKRSNLGGHSFWYLFLLLSSSLSRHNYFPRRGCPRIVKFGMGS